MLLLLEFSRKCFLVCQPCGNSQDQQSDVGFSGCAGAGKVCSCTYVHVRRPGEWPFILL